MASSPRIFTFFYLPLCFYLVNVDLVSEAQPHKVREITSIAHTVGQIPCPVDSFEDVAMILWFKDSNGTPIYSYDARNTDEEPRHMTLKNDWGLRLYFRVSPTSRRPPALIIRDLVLADAGLYRCRIDYRSVPTSNFVFRLNIIQPPTHMEVLDMSRSQPIADQQIVHAGQHSNDQSTNPNVNDITYVGPYTEGQNVTIICSAYGGVPLPEVIWFRNGVLVDETYELVGNNYAANELSISHLERNHSLDLYTCQASNNNETKPISHRVNLDVYLTVKHIEVEIPDQMTAGVEYNIVCTASGAYPTVRMEFWKAARRIGPKYQIRSDPESVIHHSITFKPEVVDDGSAITCKCDNPWIENHFVETRRQLRVVYSPIVLLRFGSQKTSNFSEGESVLLECHVKANPQHHSISWFFQNQEMAGNEPGVQIKGMTLLLQQLVHTSAGLYHCEAVNEYGKGISNVLYLQLNFTPKCISSLITKVPYELGEAHNLTCNILAWPPDVNFYWTVNRSGDVLPIPHSGQIVRTQLEAYDEGFPNYANIEDLNSSMSNGGPPNPSTIDSYWNTSRLFRKSYLVQGVGGVIPGTGRRRDLQEFKPNYIRHQSILLYRLNSSLEYDTTIGCWAQNSYGQQIQPCQFQIIRRPEFKDETRVGAGKWEESTAHFNGNNGKGLEKGEEEVKVGGKAGNEARGNLTYSIIERDTHLNEEKETFLTKLYGTYSLDVLIVMGVLIFMASLCLLGCLWFCISARHESQGRTRQTTSIFNGPSPSIHPSPAAMAMAPVATVE